MNRNSHGRDIFETMRDLPEVFEIVGYAIVEDERETCADRLDVFSGYPEMTVEEILADGSIEAVTVETDEIHLTKYATLAIRAGKHIHMEKPGSPSLPDFEELIRAAKETGCVLHLGYMYRYNAAVSELIERVRRGELGRIICTEAQMNCIHTSEVREWLTAFPGGMTFFLGCHLIDLVLQIQGEPLRITPYNKVSGKDGTSGCDVGFAVLEYPSGVSFIKTAAIEEGGFLRRQLVVTGERGTVELRPIERYIPNSGGLLVTDKRECIGKTGWSVPGVDSTSEPQSRYKDMMLAFAAMVRGERKNPYTPDYELTLFRAVLAACGV